MKSYSAALSAMGAFCHPNQLVANYVSRELDRGEHHTARYTPYIVADLTDAPWPVPTAEHSAANTRWAGLREAAKDPKIHHLPSHGWVLYRIRFIPTSDICGARPTFGLSAQLNHSSVVPHLSTTESIPVALLYGQLLSTHLEELARSRADRVISDTPDFVGSPHRENIASIYRP